VYYFSLVKVFAVLKKEKSILIININQMKKLLLTALLASTVVLNAQSLQWGAVLTGSTSSVLDLALDPSGNLVTVGNFFGTTDFDPGPGTFNMTSGGVYVSKLSSAGNLIWAVSFNSSGAEGVCTDPSGNIYVTGNFSGTFDFDPGPGTFTMSTGGMLDVFVVKLDPSGNFVWAVSAGAAGTDIAFNITCDASNVYVIGNFAQTVDFDPGTGTSNLTVAGGNSAYVWKLTQAGALVWVKALGTNGRGIAVDGAGNIHVSGGFTGTVDFDPGPGTFNMSSSGSNDVYVAKLDASGNLIWAKKMGGVFDDISRTLALDMSGNVITSGWFSVTVDFDPGAGTANLSSAGSYDIFISKLDASGNFVWAKRVGGTGTDDCPDLATDALGNIYGAGYYSGTTADFDPGAGTYILPNSNTLYEAFVLKLDASGNFVMAGGFGSTSNDHGHGVLGDASGNIYTSGLFRGTSDFDPGVNVYNMSSSAGVDNGYVVKLNGGPLSVNENFSNDHSFSVYPNPSNGIFSLNFTEEVKGGKQLTVFDITGKEILKQIIQAGIKQTELEIKTPGMYFINLEADPEKNGTGGKRMVKKVVVQ
jgi:hypothetical protein